MKLAGGLVPLRVVGLAHDLGVELRALLDCSHATTVSGRFV
jgi:hypothetical protein